MTSFLLAVIFQRFSKFPKSRDWVFILIISTQLVSTQYYLTGTFLEQSQMALPGKFSESNVFSPILIFGALLGVIYHPRALA